MNQISELSFDSNAYESARAGISLAGRYSFSPPLWSFAIDVNSVKLKSKRFLLHLKTISGIMIAGHMESIIRFNHGIQSQQILEHITRNFRKYLIINVADRIKLIEVLCKFVVITIQVRLYISNRMGHKAR